MKNKQMEVVTRHWTSSCIYKCAGGVFLFHRKAPYCEIKAFRGMHADGCEIIMFHTPLFVCALLDRETVMIKKQRRNED